MENKKSGTAGDEHYIAALFRSLKDEDDGGKILYNIVDVLSKRFGYKKINFICDMLIAGCLSSTMISNDFEQIVDDFRGGSGGKGAPKFCMSVERVRGLLNR